MKRANLTVVVGRTQTGKTWSIDRDTANLSRLLVWDIEGVWAGRKGFTSYYSMPPFMRWILGHADEDARMAVFTGSPDHFDAFCKTAYWWGRAGFDVGKPSAVIAEEIAFTTGPGKAPPGWHRLLAQGLKWGLDIWAVTQRPQESDKTCIGNATIIRCFAQTRPSDRLYMANYMDVDPAVLAALRPHEYLQRNVLSGALTRNPD